MSTVIRPVKQVAEVAVNKASESGVPAPDAEDQGAANRAVPAAMTPRKPRATAMVGRRCLRRRPTLNVMLTAMTLDPSRTQGKSYFPLDSPMRRHASAMSPVVPAKQRRTHLLPLTVSKSMPGATATPVASRSSRAHVRESSVRWPTSA